jgi:N-acetylglucosamine-6-sulfatase
VFILFVASLPHHAHGRWVSGSTPRRPWRSPRARALATALAAGVAIVLVALLSSGGAGRPPAAAGQVAQAAPARSARAAAPAGRQGRKQAAPASTRRPNIVFVLTDDLSMDLVRFMPQVQALETRGMAFDNYFVSDSLCCPSRTSIFTGEFPHNSGVFTNAGSDGGMTAFYSHNDEDKAFNVALQQAGYRTAMMGKYINGYLDGPNRSPVPDTYVPPGWNEWDVAGWGYPEFNYTLNQDGRLHHYGHRPADYLTDVLAKRGVSFINRSAKSDKPFFLELATFTPHYPYTPAPRDRQKFAGLQAPEPPSFNRLPTSAPAWLAGRPPLTKRQISRVNAVFRKRVQDVQSIDDMMTQINETLQKHHLLGNTYVVFSSDNGLHTGEYRLMPGKLTAFDTDIHVPLVIAGPGVLPDSTSDAMAENVDLADTFTAMAGTVMPDNDGASLMPLLRSIATPADWRNAVLIEHHGATSTGPASNVPANPDAQTRHSGNPPSYEAMRSKRFLYVEYDDGERELYDLASDPDELHNLAGDLSAQSLATLHSELLALEDCHGHASCWAAGHVSPSPY